MIHGSFSSPLVLMLLRMLMLKVDDARFVYFGPGADDADFECG